jgi:hypothetical protein
MTEQTPKPEPAPGPELAELVTCGWLVRYGVTRSWRCHLPFDHNLPGGPDREPTPHAMCDGFGRTTAQAGGFAMDYSR